MVSHQWIDFTTTRGFKQPVTKIYCHKNKNKTKQKKLNFFTALNFCGFKRKSCVAACTD
jgi:hypothetical protein